jgi:hypothetical protein
MKRSFIVLLAILISLGLEFSVHAEEYICDGIILAGADYSDISNVWDIAQPDIDGWEVVGDVIVSGWADHWVEYSTELSAGNWRIGLNAINQWGPLPSGYIHFEVLTELYDDDQEILSGTIEIPASDAEVNHSFVDIDIDSDGLYTVRYTWLNDAIGPCADANIQINSVFFCKNEEDPLVLIGDITAFFDASVNAGTLEGYGTCPAAAKWRLMRFRRALVLAGKLIEDGYFRPACFVLGRCDRRSDDVFKPLRPDWVVGDDKAELSEMIVELRTILGCGSLQDNDS